MKKVLLTLIGQTMAGMKPIATSILSACLKQKGHKVILFDSTFLDLGVSLDSEMASSLKQFKKVDYKKYGMVKDYCVDAKAKFLDLLEKERPDVIAASCMTDMFPYTLEFLKLAKDKFSIPVIVGGVHPTLNPDEVISYDCIDALCIGEGEEALIEYLDNLSGTGLKSCHIRNLWIKQNGVILRNPIRPLVNLDSLPFLDYSIYDKRQFNRAYMGKMYIGGDVEEKRGCPRICSYCANAVLNTKVYNKTRVNRYSPERFVEEMKYLKKTWGINFCKFYSEDIADVNLDELARLSKLYREQVNIPFTAGAYPLSLTKEKVRLLKDMNCVSISIALECGNERYRADILKRRYSNKLFNEKVALLNDAGIRSYVLTMIGLPFEDRKMIFETIHTARAANPKGVNCSCYFPYRGTPLGDLAIREGYVSEESLKQKGVRFHRGRTCLIMPQITADEVNNIRKMWFYYMNSPKWLFPLIKRCERESRLNKVLLMPIITLATSIRTAFKGRI